MSRNSTCVHRAGSVGEADIVAAWLEDRGIEVEIKDRFVVDTLQIPGITSPTGIQVCVVDPEEAQRAIDLLTEHGQEIHRTGQTETSSATIDATCEECGSVTAFPHEQHGRVETCPHCRAHLDVPDG